MVPYFKNTFLILDKMPAYTRCNFEDSFCGWTVSEDSTISWLRHKGSTPTFGTGPDHDHTFKNESGKLHKSAYSFPKLIGLIFDFMLYHYTEL